MSSDPINEASYFTHDKALVETRTIGRGTRIWAFAHILPGAKIGEDCNICDHTFIENDVTVGNRVTVKCGVHLWDGITLEDDVFVGPNANFTNDPFPRSRQYPGKFARTVVHRGASIGAGATILPGITIGERAMIGAGAVVTRDVPPLATVVGNPARIVGYVGADSPKPAGSIAVPPEQPSVASTNVPNVTLHRLPFFQDLRGMLTVGEAGTHIPFDVKRYFLTYGVTSGEVRGEHAHRKCHQFLICVHGRCHVVADDGKTRQEFVLDNPTLGVYLPAMVWGTQYKYTSDAVLLVFASARYDAADYIRDYSEFLKLTAGRND